MAGRAARQSGKRRTRFHALHAALSRNLEVGDRVLYRSGSREKEHLGLIENITEDSYYVLTKDCRILRLSLNNQCVFCPSPWIVEERAKVIRDSWKNPQLRSRLELPPPEQQLSNGFPPFLPSER